MKKLLILTLIMSVVITCAIGVLSVSAADEASSPAIKISALKNDGVTTDDIKSYDDIEDGWSYGISLAKDLNYLEENDYSMIVIDILTDWKAKDGEFTDITDNPVGFNWDTLDVPKKSRLMINLNGHTIDRDLDDWQYNGEVLCIGDDATVIINGGSSSDDATLGTITGGCSSNGAGGIHINDRATVVLNNVCVVGNATDGDDGAGIALYHGAKLIMNGGKLSNNTIRKSFFIRYVTGIYGGAAVYARNADIELNGVELSGNRHKATCEERNHGTVIELENSSAKLTNCKIFDNVGNGHNGIDDYVYNHKNASLSSIFCVRKGSFTFTDCEIYNNSNAAYLISINDESAITMKDCKVHDNQLFNTLFKHSVGEAEIYVEDSTFQNRGSHAICFNREYANGYNIKGHFKNCTFDNDIQTKKAADFYFDVPLKELVFENCDFGNGTFDGEKHIVISSSHTASILGEGSFSVIFSAAALIVSVCTCVIVVTDKSKKAESKKGSAKQ